MASPLHCCGCKCKCAKLVTCCHKCMPHYFIPCGCPKNPAANSIQENSENSEKCEVLEYTTKDETTRKLTPTMYKLKEETRREEPPKISEDELVPNSYVASPRAPSRISKQPIVQEQLVQSPHGKVSVVVRNIETMERRVSLADSNPIIEEKTLGDTYQLVEEDGEEGEVKTQEASTEPYSMYCVGNLAVPDGGLSYCYNNKAYKRKDIEGMLLGANEPIYEARSKNSMKDKKKCCHKCGKKPSEPKLKKPKESKQKVPKEPKEPKPPKEPKQKVPKEPKEKVPKEPKQKQPKEPKEPKQKKSREKTNCCKKKKSKEKVVMVDQYVVAPTPSQYQASQEEDYELLAKLAGENSKLKKELSSLLPPAQPPPPPPPKPKQEPLKLVKYTSTSTKTRPNFQPCRNVGTCTRKRAFLGFGGHPSQISAQIPDSGPHTYTVCLCDDGKNKKPLKLMLWNNKPRDTVSSSSSSGNARKCCMCPPKKKTRQET